MVNFLNNKEQKIAKEFLKNGYVIRKTNNEKALAWIKKLFNKIILQKKKLTPSFQKDPFNKAHKYIRKDELNNFRISLMNKLNREKEFRKISKMFLKMFSIQLKFECATTVITT